LTKWNKCIFFNNVIEWFITAINLLKELVMFEVSEKAGEVIKQFIEGKEGPHSIRITLNEGG
jgi:phage anti-repressor protein